MRRLTIAPLLCIALGAQGAVSAELTAAQGDAVARLVTAFMAKHGVPGLSVAIVVDGRLAWSSGYGVADVENAVPAKATTAYRSASIGKPMTATAAMQLAQDGRLDLNADIRDYCPAFPEKPWRITSLHLLGHRSGIRHYGGPHDDEEQYSTIHYGSVAEALAPFKGDPLLFEPGTRFLYSTYGFDVLGCVIEGAARASFLEYMRTRVWGPAGMDATRDDDPSALVPNRANGYVRSSGELRRARMADVSNRLPAGGYLTTAIDLARFAEAVLAGRLVTRETFERMTTPARLPDGETVPYGLGWHVETEPWHEDTWIAHGGSSPGASGILALMPRHRFAVAVLTNLENAPDRDLLAEDITRAVLAFSPRTE
jgi:serine beta-lactamase-like protein LACTB